MLGVILAYRYIMDKVNTNIAQVIRHLNWLRLRYHHIYKDGISANLITKIILYLQNKSNEPSIIDKICNKLYYGFNIKKDSSSLFDIGYTDEERDAIRKHVLSVIKEYNTLV